MNVLCVIGCQDFSSNEWMPIRLAHGLMLRYLFIYWSNFKWIQLRFFYDWFSNCFKISSWFHQISDVQHQNIVAFLVFLDQPCLIDKQTKLLCYKLRGYDKKKWRAGIVYNSRTLKLESEFTNSEIKSYGWCGRASPTTSGPVKPCKES